MAEAEFGESPTLSGDTVRMPSGALVVLKEFSFDPFPGFGVAAQTTPAGTGPLLAALMAAVHGSMPFSEFLTLVREELLPAWPFERFRFVQIGIPLTKPIRVPPAHH